jgi:hypothetical protein
MTAAEFWTGPILFFGHTEVDLPRSLKKHVCFFRSSNELLFSGDCILAQSLLALSSYYEDNRSCPPIFRLTTVTEKILGFFRLPCGILFSNKGTAVNKIRWLRDSGFWLLFYNRISRR